MKLVLVDTTSSSPRTTCRPPLPVTSSPEPALLPYQQADENQREAIARENDEADAEKPHEVLRRGVEHRKHGEGADHQPDADEPAVGFGLASTHSTPALEPIVGGRT
jgi:hypothetical protein